MAVILTILKITGIVLLCIIALILILAAIVLFVPIRYRIRADKPLEEDFTAFAGISFLLHILSGKIVYDKDIDYNIRLFGLKIYPRKKKDDISDGPVTDVNPGEKEEQIKPEEDIPTQDISETGYEIDWNESESVSEPENDDSQDIETSEEDDDLFDKAEAFIEGIIEKISSKYGSISEKYESIRFRIRFFDKMRNDDRNQEAVAYLKKKALKLLKKLAPRRVRGFVHFGFEDPATTGKILMYLALVYPILPRKLTIDPGFDDTDVYGNIYIKGHFSLITPALCFLGIYFNKDIRRMRRLFKKYKEKVS